MKKNVCKWLSAALAVVMTVALLPMGGLVSAATNSMPVTTNLVSNGDFELLKSGVATYWHGGAFTADAAHAGNYGACVGVEENDGGQVYTTIAVDQGCSYLLTFYAKVNAGTLVARITGDTSGELFLNEVCTNSDWSLYTFVVSVGTADQSAKLAFIGDSSDAQFYVDDVILVLSGAAETTVLTNGSFESGNASGWTLNSGTTVTDDQTHSGDYAIMTTNTATKYQNIGRQYFAVEPNTDYTLTFWYMYVGNATPSFYVYALNGDDAKITNTTIYPAAANTWYQATLSWNSGSYTENWINMQNRTANDGGVYYFDDFVITGGSSSDGSTEIPTNLISNSTFETGAVTGWSSGSSSAKITINSNNAHTGSYGAMIPCRNKTFTGYQDVTVEADTNYIISFFYKSTNTDAGLSMALGAFTGGTAVSSSTALNSDYAILDCTKTEWTLATYSFNSGANTSVRVGFGCTTYNTLSNFMYIDDIVMVKQFTSFPEESIKGTYYTATGSYAGINKQVFPAEEGKTYRISFSTRAMTNGFRLRVNNYSDNSMFYAETNRAWTDVSLTYRTETDNLTLELVNLSTEHLETNFYITDYVIEEIPDDEVDIFTYDGKSAMEMNGNLANEEDGKGGLAFKYTVAMNNAVVAAGNHSVEGSAGMIYQQNSAIAHPFTNDEYSTPYDYKVVEVGAIVSREYSNMDDLTLDNVNGTKTIQIKGEKRWDVGADYYSYVVRVRNIPEAFWGDEIYVRAYAIVETANGTRQVTLYDDIMAHGNYDATIQGNVPQPE